MNKIEVVKVLGRSLDSRDQAQKLFDVIGKMLPGLPQVILNFNGIEFMSRSFADQYYQEMLRIERSSKIIIKIEAANNQVLEILHAVSKTQYSKDNRRSIIKQINVYAFPEMRNLKDYLLGI